VFSITPAVTGLSAAGFRAAGVAAPCGGASTAETFSVVTDSGSTLSVAGTVVACCIKAALDAAGLLGIGDGR
jgi:hypothetical protein